MRKVVVKARQRLIDIAIQEYGSVMGLQYLVKDNNLSFTSEINAGDILLISAVPIKKEIYDFFKNEKINPITEIAYASVTPLGSFNKSFNKSFK